MHYADFSYADLRDADLRGARCLRTQLHRALQDGARWDSRIGVLENDPALYEAELWSARRRAGP
ncbi:pentapeptide repeat-containing protein [Bordetella parapertussis]|uniref:Pentapeptide repeat-containing protein n=1 Tax=Bordetella parapertussis TaxID=519 RepID=A0ABU5XB95_BORPP|nr:pentapeptide repeat-containing protein [Bordetella parapertussis]MEB2665886.1 pentapeptide repeat-containing protein [Bordetella parapertussis]WNY40614.1 pentapeptide repeat-containing protein [Bordetella parapertussis]